jgi:hypothetical protein
MARVSDPYAAITALVDDLMDKAATGNASARQKLDELGKHRIAAAVIKRNLADKRIGRFFEGFLYSFSGVPRVSA